MKKYSFSIAAICLIAGSLQAQTQTWVSEMQDPNGNLYTAQHLFHQYWLDKDSTAKGKGYKAFKRWEDFASPRVYPTGELSVLGQTGKNFADWYATYQQQVQNNNTGGGGKFGDVNNGNIIASTTWTAIGPMGPISGTADGQFLKAGRICFVATHPTNTLNLYAGTPAGGFWRSTNGGTTWTTNTDNLTVTGCSDLAIDPTNPNIMYLAMGDGDAGDTKSIGVLKSTDGGNTWNTTGLTYVVTSNFLIRRLIINPTNTQILLAATNSGIFRTTNGGTSWTNVDANNCYDLEFNPTNPSIVYSSGTSFRRSADGGATWTQINSGIATSGVERMAIAVTPANANVVYVIASSNANSGFLGFYRSTNGGTSFSTIPVSLNLLGWASGGNDTGGQGWYDLSIAASPTNSNEVVTGGVNVWRTTNGGTNWSIYGHWTGTGAPFTHADHHDLEYDFAGNLYDTNDGTIYRRNGGTWQEISGTMNISQVYKVGTSALTANLWVSGHQDNGSSYWNGTTYTAQMGGDGMDCFIDRTNNSNKFAEYYQGQFMRSIGGGAYAACTSGITGTPPWVTIWKQDPQNATRLYAGLQNLFVSNNLGTSWTSLTALPSPGTDINEFAIAPSNNQVIYVLKNSGIYKSINGGTSWTTITGVVPVGSAAPSNIIIDPLDPNNAWVTLSGYSAGNKIFVTTNGGTNWTNFTSNLPNLPANCAVYQPNTADRIYVGMDVGVYYRDNIAATWTLYNNGLPNTPVRDMEISPADPTKIVAATYGRGMWKVDVIADIPPVTAFSVTGAVCANMPKVFNDISTNGPTSWSWSVTPTGGVTINTPTLQNPSITFTGTGTYTVSLFTSNMAGAGTTSSQTITVYTTPSVVITNSVLNICSGSSVNISGSGTATYSWNTGATTSVIAVSPGITTIYTLTGGNGTCTSAPKTATVNVTTTPIISANSTVICLGDVANLNVSGASTYTWNTGSNSNNIAVSPTVTTVYTVTGKSGSCTSVPVTSTVTVNPLPNITAVPSDTFICIDQTLTLTANGALNYTWQPMGLEGSPITFTPTGTQVYTVTGIDGNNCVSTQTIEVRVDACTGIIMNGKEKVVFTVFPNPASDNISIRYPSTSPLNITVELTDAAGRLVLKKPYTFSKEHSTLNLTLTDVSKGVFFVKLYSDNGESTTLKLVKN